MRRADVAPLARVALPAFRIAAAVLGLRLHAESVPRLSRRFAVRRIVFDRLAELPAWLPERRSTRHRVRRNALTAPARRRRTRRDGLFRPRIDARRGDGVPFA